MNSKPAQLHPAQPILLVDDEATILETLRLTLRAEGLTNVVTLQDSRQVLPLLQQQPLSLVILDLMMPHLSGMDLLTALMKEAPELPVVILTAVNEVETAVECMRAGAFDYLTKPVESGQLAATVRNALRVRTLTTEVTSLKKSLLSVSLDHPGAFADIITCSPRMYALFRYVEAIARSREPVLLTGETGVGKELFARAIHATSGREGEFVAVNISGLDDTLFSDTLFGHSRGAFTGAAGPREGLIAKAASGTLFLDEIGDLDESSQVKLLRLLQQGEYYPVGSDSLRRISTHVVVATNRNLYDRVAEGKFRSDLYYRLCSHHIHVPPLRERPEDIPLLCTYFAAEASRALDREPPPALSPEVIASVSSYAFPGNIRELRSLVLDAVARCQEKHLTLACFPALESSEPVPALFPGAAPGSRGASLIALFGKFPTVKQVIDVLIDEALTLTSGNQSAAAALLDISRPTLNKRIKRRSPSV
jgi:DNA-binding NtrC family response regulator